MLAPFRTLCLAILLACGGPLLAVSNPLGALTTKKRPPREIQQLAHDDLKQVTGIAISPDGKQAYAAAFGCDQVTTFDRNPVSGKLTYRKSLTAPHFDAGVSIHLSPDGKYAALSAFRSDTLVLLGRDQVTGDLSDLDHVGGEDEPRPGLGFCIDHAFSQDSRFLYAAGSRGIAAFAIVDGKLESLQTVSDADPERRVLSGARGIMVSPDGNWLYSSWNGSGSLVVMKRDLKTGKLSPHQEIVGEPGLEGVMHVNVSADGKHVYTAAGRMGGADAVMAFSVGEDGILTTVQSIMGEDLPEHFGGGNEIDVSPDGKTVAVACTLSDHLIMFQRDARSGILKALSTVESGALAKPGACGIAFGPNGRSLIVADENSHSLVVFRLPVR